MGFVYRSMEGKSQIKHVLILLKGEKLYSHNDKYYGLNWLDGWMKQRIFKDNSKCIHWTCGKYIFRLKVRISEPDGWICLMYLGGYCYQI